MIPGQAIMIIYPDMKSNFIKDICHGSFLHISLCGYDKVDTSVKPEKLHYTVPMLYFLSLYCLNNHFIHCIFTGFALATLRGVEFFIAKNDLIIANRCKCKGVGSVRVHKMELAC